MPLLFGKPLADQIITELREQVDRLPMKPGLAAILVGDYIESHKYVSLKEERAKEVGIHFEKLLFPATVDYQTLLTTIDNLNTRPDIHGILLQLPLPAGLPTDTLVNAIRPEKDVDGFHPDTVKKFLSGEGDGCPVFPRAVIELIRSTKADLYGKRGVAIVNSDRLGQVLVEALKREGLQSEYVLSSASKEDVALKTREALVVVTACGIPDLLTADMLSSQAIVIDGGNVHVDGKVRGDVEHNGVLAQVAWLSPVPGGVGPLTIAFLLERVTRLSIVKKEY